MTSLMWNKTDKNQPYVYAGEQSTTERCIGDGDAEFLKQNFEYISYEGWCGYITQFVNNSETEDAELIV